MKKKTAGASSTGGRQDVPSTTTASMTSKTEVRTGSRSRRKHCCAAISCVPSAVMMASTSPGMALPMVLLMTMHPKSVSSACSDAPPHSTPYTVGNHSVADHRASWIHTSGGDSRLGSAMDSKSALPRNRFAQRDRRRFDNSLPRRSVAAISDSDAAAAATADAADGSMVCG